MKIYILILLILLSSCSFQSRESFVLDKTSILSRYDSESRVLDLSNLGITWFVTLGEHLAWSVVNTIDISGNNIQKLDVSQVDTLVRLDVSQNDIIFSSDLELPPTIRHLNIRENGLRDLSNFQQLSKIKTMDLSSNELEDTDIFLRNFPKIEYVNINDNVLITAELRNAVDQLNNRYEFRWEAWYIK